MEDKGKLIYADGLMSSIIGDKSIPHTDEHKKKISESMKAYREKEKAERGYCYNGRGERKDGDGNG